MLLDTTPHALMLYFEWIVYTEISFVFVPTGIV